MNHASRLFAILLLVLFSSPSHAAPFGTAFTYQGQLSNGGNPAHGSYDLVFSLHDAAINGSQVGSSVTNAATPVAAGLFTVPLEFGAAVFDGNARWLEIAVRTNGSGVFVALNPRQPLSPAPHAIYATKAGTAVTATTATTANTANAVAGGSVGTAGLATGAVDSSRIADGAIGTADLSPTVLSNTFWRLGGNRTTVPGTDFLGTADNQALEFKVNGQRALRLEPTATSEPNIVAGHGANLITSGVGGATIAGGGGASGWQNSISGGANYSTIGGGRANVASALDSTVAGGGQNRANGDKAAVGGGYMNRADASAATVAGGYGSQAAGSYSAVGGGFLNIVSNDYATIAGGRYNTNRASSGSIGGGDYNRVNAPGATVPGGQRNTASGASSLAAGQDSMASGNSAVAMGFTNLASGDYSVSLGSRNTASGLASTALGDQTLASGMYAAAIGYYSQATGIYSAALNYNTTAGGFGALAAGTQAKAVHDGTFVWADHAYLDFASTRSNQFLVRASGGVGIGTNNPQAALHVVGTVIASNFLGSGAGLTTLNGAALADNSVTATKFAPGAVNHLDAPDGSPTAALQVNTNGLVGIGTNAPQAGLDIQTSGSHSTPTIHFQVRDGTGSYTNLSWAGYVAAHSNLVAIGAAGAGVTLLDATQPSYPQILWQVRDGMGAFTNLHQVGHVALTPSLLAISAGNDNAVTLVSITNPASPVKVAELRGGTGSLAQCNWPESVAMAGNLMAVVGSASHSVALVSLANPSSPVQLSVISNGAGAFTNLFLPVSVALSGNLLAIAAQGSDAVTLVSVANLANPVKLAEIRHGTGSYTLMDDPTCVALSGNLMAVMSIWSDVTLVDVTNPSQPVWLANLPALHLGFGGSSRAPTALAFAGNRLAVAAHNDNQVRFYNITDPAHPQLLGEVKASVDGADYLHGPQGLAFVGTNLVVAAGWSSAATVLGFSPAPSGLFSQGWVGIGTRLPAAPLHVVGNVVVEDAQLFNVNTHRVELGDRTTATGDGSVALGVSTKASGLSSTAMGYSTAASGLSSTAMGYDTTASGAAAFAAGTNTLASGFGAVALGVSTKATNDASTAMGNTTTASGHSSTAMGYFTEASGDYSTAMGYANTASGDHSTAMGDVTAASGYASAAMGLRVTASGYASTAMGHYTTASGDLSTALGSFTTASGYCSTAMGRSTTATNNAFAAGYRAKANHMGTFVWADSTDADFASTAADQFLIRAAGGVGIGTNNPQAALHVAGTVKADAFVGTGATPASFPSLGVGTSAPQDAVLDVEGHMHLNDFELFLRAGTDRGHGLGWYGSSKPFAGINVDGPVLYGWTGGGLGSMTGGARLALQWDATGSVAVDAGTANAGSLAPGLVFGGVGSGEGISSKRTAGANQFSLNFHTSFSNRMTILNTGDVGIGTLNPARRLHVMDGSGATQAGGSIQVGMATTGGDPKLVYFGDGDYVHIGENGADDTMELKASRFFFTGGNLGIDTNNPAYKIHLAGGAYCNGTQWVNASDRDRKEGFQAVDSQEILDRVAALPLSTWSYKDDPSSRHVGPIAQDFHAAFGFGNDAKAIGTVDADGVALAAIQGLNQKVEVRSAKSENRIRELAAQNAALEKQVAELKALVESLAAKVNEGAR